MVKDARVRFIKWDYDNHIAIEYRRTGECNRCGECCKPIINIHVSGMKTNTFGAGVMGNTTDGAGIWAEYTTGKMRRFIGLGEVEKEESPCYLLKDNCCTMQATKSLRIGGQGALCMAWPIIPEHVELFENCSYHFEEVNRWTIQ